MKLNLPKFKILLERGVGVNLCLTRIRIYHFPINCCQVAFLFTSQEALLYRQSYLLYAHPAQFLNN